MPLGTKDIKLLIKIINTPDINPLIGLHPEEVHRYQSATIWFVGDLFSDTQDNVWRSQKTCNFIKSKLSPHNQSTLKFPSYVELNQGYDNFTFR
jgi:hypothetical protein